MKTSIKFRTACIAALCLLMLYSCDGYEPRYAQTIYTYHNNSSSEILIAMTGSGAYLPDMLTIPKGKSTEIMYHGADAAPFKFHFKIEITNGESLVTQNINIPEYETLFYRETYERTTKGQYTTQYDYTFTDDFFKDGTPIAED